MLVVGDNRSSAGSPPPSAPARHNDREMGEGKQVCPLTGADTRAPQAAARATSGCLGTRPCCRVHSVGNKVGSVVADATPVRDTGGAVRRPQIRPPAVPDTIHHAVVR